MNTFEKKFLDKAKEIPEGVTPGFVLQVYQKGELCFDIEWGKTWRYYDLASLTKILFTVPLVMKAVELKKVTLTQPVSTYLPWCPQTSRVQQLLNHTAGNDWWQPFYKEMNADFSVEENKNILKNLIRYIPVKKNGVQSVYSDIDFFLLGFILENVFEQNWNSLFQRFNQEALGGSSLFFHPLNCLRFEKSKYAPTEKDSWRKRLLQGEVHDENAWALGGVAPHAGLFGDVQSVAQWGQWLRRAYYGEDPWLKTNTVKQFAKRSLNPRVGDWGLGFMLPTQGSASCGSQMSLTSIGHTGFTGTSFWFDPVKDIFIVLLSNRVHPTRKNEQFRQWRPQIHNWVMEILKE